ncbi:glycosyltransferase family 4 protein [Roseiconus nitratireducens]|uniref:Glycosyltransferase family 4 protein n=1 Tax=Roseiconus nitratireducens TaxID=2605748 RepID=A0A5M6CW37_9BACT|nr:glycosyltransferase family 4 protein [Roseiconus nitratireducens]KAA5539293.1 glycosyltransferase family 4 protein [Roseiconus nitratireducens]
MAAIAQIVESFAYGTAKSVLQLCRFIGPEHRITIFYGVRPGTDLELPEVDPRVTLTPLPGSGPAKHASNVRFLARSLQRGFDVVHGHSSYGGLYAKLTGPKLGLRTLYSPRGYSFLRQDFPAVSRWAFRTVESLTAKRCTTISCGPYEHRLSQELGGESICINNGFDIRRPLAVDQLRPVVLGVGRICPQKGFDRFLDIAKRCPEHEFLWVGESAPGCEPDPASVPANLRLLPYLPHEQLLDQITHSRVIMLPSRWEGLSRFLIESVCMGKAIITSRFPANLDCLDGDPKGQQFANGFACEEIEDYVGAIGHLMADDGMLQRMQQASHRFAKQNFDIDIIAQRWRELYDSTKQTV